MKIIFILLTFLFCISSIAYENSDRPKVEFYMKYEADRICNPHFDGVLSQHFLNTFHACNRSSEYCSLGAFGYGTYNEPIYAISKFSCAFKKVDNWEYLDIFLGDDAIKNFPSMSAGELIATVNKIIE